jgi:murein DD-endopeptidase MepM/ murein hydrolase activator NlpD
MGMRGNTAIEVMAMDSVFSERSRRGKRRAGGRLRQPIALLARGARATWAARGRYLPGLIAGLLVVGGGIYLATGLHGGQPATGVPRGTMPARPAPRHRGRTPRGKPVAPTASPLALPVAGPVEQGFGWVYSRYLGEWYYNPGITVAAAAGSPVHAAWGGSVSAVARSSTEGLTVTVDDGNGYATVYGHLSTAVVTPGDPVSQGTVIGTVAGPSLYSREPGAHLDFEVIHDGQPINPEGLVKGAS